MRRIKYPRLLLVLLPQLALAGFVAAQPTDNDLLAGFCLGAGQIEAADSEKALNDWSAASKVKEASKKFESNHLSRFQDYLTARGFPGANPADQTAVAIAIGQGKGAATECIEGVSKKTNECRVLMPLSAPFDFQSYERRTSSSRGTVSSCERVDRCHKPLGLPF